jgi:uridine phosphorylase
LCRERGGRRHFLFNSNLYVVPVEDGDAFVAGPAVGAPMAVMTVEKLIAMGAASILVLGWCGAIAPALKTGDLFLPFDFVSEEGTSQHYPLNHKPVASPRLHALLVDHFSEGPRTLHKGTVWTTDAPYRETREKVEKYASRGVLAVEMEFAALITLAFFRGIELAGLYLVSDELYHESWRPGFMTKSFKRASDDVFRSLFDCFAMTRGV